MTIYLVMWFGGERKLVDLDDYQAALDHMSGRQVVREEYGGDVAEWIDLGGEA